METRYSDVVVAIPVLVSGQTFRVDLLAFRGRDGHPLWSRSLAARSSWTGNAKAAMPDLTVEDLDGDGASEVIVVDHVPEALQNLMVSRSGKQTYQIQVLDGRSGQPRGKPWAFCGRTEARPRRLRARCLSISMATDIEPSLSCRRMTPKRGWSCSTIEARFSRTTSFWTCSRCPGPSSFRPVTSTAMATTSWRFPFQAGRKPGSGLRRRPEPPSLVSYPRRVRSDHEGHRGLEGAARLRGLWRR